MAKGPARKPVGMAVGHRHRDEVVLLRGIKANQPATPRGWTPKVREAWREFWDSDISQLAPTVSRPAVRRLFDLYDQRERALALVRSRFMVKGSTGQLRLNPAASYVLALEPAILRLETELGLTPLARVRLGIAVGEAKMTAQELNKIAEPAGEADDEGDEELRSRFHDAN